jgi:hypothetical protein
MLASMAPDSMTPLSGALTDASPVFIDRPIFAGVLSIVVFLAGAIAMFALPISEYPEVVPPSIVVRAVYPGANPRVLSEAVATPLEEQINGVENMLYMSSQCTSDGVLTLTVTFKIGTDVDLAQVQVQNRVSQALPRLPEEVRTLGVTTVKSSPDLTMVVHLVSPDNRYDMVYLRNYAVLQVKDVLARLPGVGQVRIFGAGDYAMRVWLDPQKVAARGLSAGDVVRAIREQNIQVAAGVSAQPPRRRRQQFRINRAADTEEIRQHHHKSAPTVPSRLGRGAHGSAPAEYSLPCSSTKEAVASAHRPQIQCHELSDRAHRWLRSSFPRVSLQVSTHDSCANDPRSSRHSGACCCGAGRDRVPADLARIDHSSRRGAGVDRRHVRSPAAVRLFDKYAHALRNGARDRHRGGRRDRRGRERRAQHRVGLRPQGGDIPRDARGERTHHRHHADAVRGIRADRIRVGPDRSVLSPVRADDRGLDDHLAHRLAHALPGHVRAAPQTAQGAQ